MTEEHGAPRHGSGRTRIEEQLAHVATVGEVAAGLRAEATRLHVEARGQRARTARLRRPAAPG